MAGTDETTLTDEMEVAFYEWWMSNAYLLEAGAPADFNHLRLMLNAAVTNKLSSEGSISKREPNCSAASAISVA